MMSTRRGLAFLPLLPMCLASKLKRRASSSAHALAGGLCLCPPTYAIGLSMEENDLLQMAHQSTAHSSKHTNKTLERLCEQQEPISIIN